ncbi:DUF948 domain-containing protein [Paenibacillus eucommiae]|uniref:Uncharacterized protein YoxC n=1 Tax=Paenibacillus eucommiae TaxID=1355755 RepID=A0ABS4IN26_9BACL|nr:DUF948 domain-containing protein [Paenibacillus eucommiae]MBP1988973.1 uncharacterized protein YoxC [Paenibacillus eucommiae]
MIIEWSVAVIALAFVVLVVYLIITLRSLSAMIQNTSQTLSNVEKQVGALTTDTSELLQHTKEIVVDVQGKLQAMNSAFASFKQSGEAAKEVTTSVRQVSSAVADFIRAKKPERLEKPVKQNTAVDRTAEIIKVIPVFLELFRKLRKSP